MVDGNDRRVEICILERAARCKLVVSVECRARNADDVAQDTRDSTTLS